jgi:tRNA pseudouridine38-40 synthase
MSSPEREGERTRRIALLLEYDGSRYGGSQIQKNAPTIQGELEGAIGRLTGERVRAAFAGRTDAGCHARGQVASFLTRRPHDIEVFVRGLNYWLPDDVAVRQAVEVPPRFDVRRRARRRLYRYLVDNGPARSPLLRQRAWHVGEPLDLEAMQEAAICLVGRHDFGAFAGSLEEAGASTVRTVYGLEVRRSGRLIAFDMEADAFLPHQVRRTVGALVQVGLGKQTASDIEEMLRQPAAGTAGPTAPPQGLCLMRVTYPERILDEETDIDEDLQC